MGTGSKNLTQILLNKDTKLYDLVLQILSDPDNVAYLDNDMALCAHVWYEEFGPEKTGAVAAFDFLQAYGEQKLSSPEKIIAEKRKIQDQYENLRGTHYEPRRIKNARPSGKGKKRVVEDDRE